MPKKEPIGPWVWNAWVKGKKEPLRMIAFDRKHIQDQLPDEKIIKIKKIPETREKYQKSEPLGPNGGGGITRPPDYDNGFKILKAWVDQNGGPSEEIRKKLRELYIDYHRVDNKRR